MLSGAFVFILAISSLNLYRHYLKATATEHLIPLDIYYFIACLKHVFINSFYIFLLLINHCKKLSLTVYPKKYAHGFCFAVLCCGYTLTDFPISIRLTSLALWQSNDCPSASKATLMNMDKYFMWIHYERLHNHNKAKHNKTVCIFLGIYCISRETLTHRICCCATLLFEVPDLQKPQLPVKSCWVSFDTYSVLLTDS